ncbi:hypothetical protein AOLI_G00117060 [Acnodon oligacanthus]
MQCRHHPIPLKTVSLSQKVLRLAEGRTCGLTPPPFQPPSQFAAPCGGGWSSWRPLLGWLLPLAGSALRAVGVALRAAGVLLVAARTQAECVVLRDEERHQQGE